MPTVKKKLNRMKYKDMNKICDSHSDCFNCPFYDHGDLNICLKKLYFLLIHKEIKIEQKETKQSEPK